MKTYTIMRKPNILDWKNIPSADIDIHLQEEHVEISAKGQLCYDDENLYVRLSTIEPNIRAEHFGLLDIPCEDSCLEFFFCPIYEDNRYFNIEYNPNCCIYLGIGSGMHDLVRLIPGAEIPFSPQASKTSNGWEIRYQIPYEFIRRFFPDFLPQAGTKMRGNFYKCGDLTEKEHFLCWNRITSTPISFHRTCDFGVLEFE